MVLALWKIIGKRIGAAVMAGKGLAVL